MVSLQRIILYLLLVVICVLWLVPVFGIIIASFKSMSEIWTDPWSFPKQITLRYFVDAWKALSPFFINSVIITIPATLLSVFIASLAAYSLARLKFVASNLIFLLLVSGLIIPGQAAMVPLYHLIDKMKMVNTYRGLILIHIAWGQPICVFILARFFATIPSELQDAASIDGCSVIGIYWRIIMPLAKSSLAVILIFQFTWIWNDFLWGLIFANTISHGPINIGLSRIKGEYLAVWNVQSAGALLAIIPTLIVFLLFQKHFVRGIMTGAIK